MKTVIVQMAERDWTERALHVACAMARSNGAAVVLLRLIEMQHLSWLGTDFGYEPLSPDASSAVWAYKSIASDYGVELRVQSFQYVSFSAALVEAAEDHHALALFADVPRHALAAWRRFQVWSLRRQLQASRCALYTLDQPVQAAAAVAQSQFETAGSHA